MKFITKILTIVIALSCLNTSVFAINNLNHNLMTTIVKNPTDNQNQNFLQGLKNVLIKVSGNPSVTTLPMIRAQFAKAPTFVKSYQTISQPNKPSQTELQITYNPNDITKILTDAGQPMWDAKRPSTLIWLAVTNNNGQTHIIDANSAATTPLSKALTNNADMRGLPILYPLLDLTDQSLTQTPSNLLSTSNIASLANRYHVDSVLAGVATPIGNQWQTKWRYVLDGAPIQWTENIGDINGVAQKTIDTVASTMIAQLALSTDTNIETQSYLRIQNINNLTDYAKVDQCIKHLKRTLSLHAVSLNDHNVTFLINYNNTLAKLASTVAKSCQMTANDNTINNSAKVPLLTFQYHGSQQ